MFCRAIKQLRPEHISAQNRNMSLISFRAMQTRLNEFFFGPDKTPWTFIRVGCAFLILATLLLMGISGNYERLYGHYGMLPRRVAVDTVYWPGFLFLIKSDLAYLLGHGRGRLLSGDRVVDARRRSAHFFPLCRDGAA